MTACRFVSPLRLLSVFFALIVGLAAGGNVVQAQIGVAANNTKPTIAVEVHADIPAGHVGSKPVVFDDFTSGCCVAPNTPDSTRVGRWMGADEHSAMVRTGEVQVGNGGTTFVASPASPGSYKPQAAPGSHYVEFDVPTNSLFPGGRPDWAQIPSPDHLLARLAAKRGDPVASPVTACNIVHVATKPGGGSC